MHLLAAGQMRGKKNNPSNREETKSRLRIDGAWNFSASKPRAFLRPTQRIFVSFISYIFPLNGETKQPDESPIGRWRKRSRLISRLIIISWGRSNERNLSPSSNGARLTLLFLRAYIAQKRWGHYREEQKLPKRVLATRLSSLPRTRGTGSALFKAQRVRRGRGGA